MPIIQPIEQRGARGRLLITTIYLLLVIASVTTVYPLLIMLSSSVSTPISDKDYSVLPRYLSDDDALFREYVYDRYGNFNKPLHRNRPRNIQFLNAHYRTEYFGFEELEIPEIDPSAAGVRKQVADFAEFKQALTQRYWVRGFDYATHRRFGKHLEKKFDGDISGLNAKYGMNHHGFAHIEMPTELRFLRNWTPDEAFYPEYVEFTDTLDENSRVVLTTDMRYAMFLRSAYLTIDVLNERYQSDYKHFSEIRLPWHAPDGEARRADWSKYVREVFPYQYLLLTGGHAAFRDFLLAKYGSLPSANAACGQNWASLDAIQVPELDPRTGPLAGEWRSFLREAAPIEHIELDTPERRYAEFLARKYASIEQLNAAYETDYHMSFDDVRLPFKAHDIVMFHDAEKGALRREFMVRNYRDVLQLVLFGGRHGGRAFFNTFLLVALMVVSTLTVDPMCAFALSRYKLRYGYKILIFLLATMAFPAEVAMIPSFLLVKDLHLLNTYWALILPGVANGFHIFLLKGFFDSLPRELYEAATIDGATEMQMFRKITVPLCMPIFAVMALGAFSSAYSSFMWAFMICPDPELWTLTVFVYDFQRQAPQCYVMASLIIMALPTLLMFLFCQRTILRGIVIPTMK